MGIGSATGEGRAVNAARAAITSAHCSRPPSKAPGASCSTSPAARDLGLFEVNEAAEIIHGVAHPDANIIFGNVIDDTMGDEVRVTVIAAGFERWEEGPAGTSKAADLASSIFSTPEPVDIFADATGSEDELDLGDDDFDVPSFLR